mmetsp:Transcript_11012/g.27775  ORF Transcript_11012/g.27775 Transcript_11012/m.27775 type:complete len:615 (+) Transcript_11012:122-1966(+)
MPPARGAAVSRSAKLKHHQKQQSQSEAQHVQRKSKDGDGTLGFHQRASRFRTYPELLQYSGKSCMENRHGAEKHSGVGYPWELPAHILFVVLLYFMVTKTIPLGQVAAAKRGVDRFAATVQFSRTHTGEGTLGDVSNVHDSIMYSRAFLTALLTPQPVVDAPEWQQKLFFLEVNRLVNSVVLVQRRVKPTDCSYDDMRPLYKQCYESLDSQEKTSGVMTLLDDSVVPYSERLGGFAVEVPLDKDAALGRFDELRKGGFWDSATREFAVRFAFHNSPGHYSANVNLVFEYSPYGQVKSDVDSAFLRFKPYSAEVGGGEFLVIQVLTLGVLLGFFSVYCWSVAKQPHPRWMLARVLRPWQLLELLNYILAAVAIIMWLNYVNNPQRNNFDFSSPDFQDIGPLSEDFSAIVFFLAVVLLLWTIRAIDFFASIGNKRLQRTSNIIEEVLKGLVPFLAIFGVIFVGFVLVAHILFGVHEDRFNGPEASAYTLLVWFVALSDGHRSTIDLPGGGFFMFLFILVAMVLLFNMFIAIVMAAHDQVVEDEDGGGEMPVNHVMADAICDRLGVGKFVGDPLHTSGAHKHAKTDKLGLQRLVEMAIEADQYRGQPQPPSAVANAV